MALGAFPLSDALLRVLCGKSRCRHSFRQRVSRAGSASSRVQLWKATGPRDSAYAWRTGAPALSPTLGVACAADAPGVPCATLASTFGALVQHLVSGGAGPRPVFSVAVLLLEARHRARALPGRFNGLAPASPAVHSSPGRVRLPGAERLDRLSGIRLLPTSRPGYSVLCTTTVGSVIPPHEGPNAPAWNASTGMPSGAGQRRHGFGRFQRGPQKTGLCCAGSGPGLIGSTG